MNPGLLVVLSGPAGVGKGTIVRKMLEKDSKFVLSISATSRIPRATESEGKNYYFKTREQFEEMIKNDELVEWVEYCGNYYGTPRALVCNEIEKGNVVILEIEVDGAINVKRLFPECVLCFIIPPDFSELEKRLRGRGTDTEDSIINRLERAKAEFKYIDSYDYLILNDSIENAAQRFFNVVQAEQMRTNRNQLLIEKFRNI
ncbi:MAG: guanylate kinase [Clostridiaceae bacterium]|nr:guanylate kinase [Clostridiaceae bacterium]